MKTRKFWRIGRAVKVLSVAVILILLAAPGADADIRRKRHRIKKTGYTQKGFAISVAPGRMGFDAEIGGLDTRRHAGGVKLDLEYGCSRRIILFGSLAGVTYETDYAEDWSMGYVDLGLRYSFVTSPRQRTRVYLSGSIGRAALYSASAFDDDSEHQYIGGSARFAAGIDHFLSGNVLLYVEVSRRAGDFDRVRHHGTNYCLADNPEFRASGFHLGLRLKL
jgi:hypothetical protein